MIENFFPQRPDAQPIIYAYEDSNPQYAEMLKVGFTSRTIEARMHEHYPTLRPGEVPYRVVFTESAVRSDGTSFMDHAVHDNLEQHGFYRLRDADGKKTEWFRCTVDDVRAAWLAVRDRTENSERRTLDFKMRPEQEAAVSKTLAFYESITNEGARYAPKFLWNAKMRFGKTFATYQLALKMGCKRVLVLTFKPAVKAAWHEDLMMHVDFEGWQFVTRDGLSFEDADPERPIVCFGSFQDFLGRDKSTGQIKARNEWVHLEDWDLVVFDEYHFGAWNDNSKNLFVSDDIDEAETTEEEETRIGKVNTGNGLDEGDLPIVTKYYLFLSGTPFRALNSGEFIEEQVYSWTYTDEQAAKEAWVKPPANPYASLPRMVMLTYQVPEDIRNIALGGEFNSFDLNLFFEAKGEGNQAEFVLKDYVQKWLDLIRGAHMPTAVDDLKLGAKKPPMPYSHSELLNVLNHTLWYLPRVNSCFAMRNLLRERQNTFFQDCTINVCAGTEAGVGVAALDKVQETMQDPLNSKSITLTCGKLTTGVTVKPWTGIFMLTNMKSPESYFQAAFRVQSPWVIDGDDGTKEIIKKECYLFDFALDRALRMVSNYSLRLSVDETGPEQKVGEFINFLPVLAYDGSTMHQVSASEILDIAMAGTSATLLARRWESALLVNVDNDTLRRLMDNEAAMNALMSIEGFRALGSDILETIVNKSDAVKKAKREKETLTPKEKKELTAEEKELKSKRKLVQEKLIKFATRIPVFMYLTDYREECLKDVITQLEPGLFKKVTGLTVADFELLVSLGVFNDGLMNDAVYKFRRYEDSSLSYTGINMHEGEKVGLFDTSLSDFDYLQMKQEESLRGGAIAASNMPKKTPKVPKDIKISVQTDKHGGRIEEYEVKDWEAAGDDWVVEALREGSFRFVDKRPVKGNLWVIGGKGIEARLKPLIEAGASFKFKSGGGKATKGKDGWWLSGYPERIAKTAEEKPLITEEELDALEPGDSVFHKAFGHGEIIEITSSSIIVAFSNDKTKSRTFMFPGTFYQGILQI